MSGTEDELPVQEAAEREAGVHRVDVREPGQVADDRPDRAAPPASRRQQVARRARPAHLGGHVAGQLQHLPVEEEEAGEAELGDQRQLLAQTLVALPGCGAGAAHAGSARRRRAGRHSASCTSAGVGPVGEVRVAVAELVREVEGRAARPAPASCVTRVAVVREAGGDLLRREQDAAPRSRAAPARSPRATCGCLIATRTSWRRSAARVVGMHVARGDRAHAERVGERRAARRSGARRRARTGAGARRRSGRGRRRGRGGAAAFGLRTASPCRAQPERQTSPSLCSASSAGSRRGFSRSPACAAVRRRQRFA